jgi:hypothetical protein
MIPGSGWIRQIVLTAYPDIRRRAEVRIAREGTVATCGPG